MGNTTNAFDFTVPLSTFLASSISDGTYSDLLETLKFDEIGNEAQATDIPSAAGQLWSNLADDYVLATYPVFYRATKVWREASIAALSALGSDDGLLADEIGYSEAENSMFHVVSVDSATTSTWSGMALSSGSVDPSIGAVRITGATALTGVLTATPGATEDDYDPGSGWPNVNVLRLTPFAGGTVLTGLDSSAGARGQLVLVCNIGSTDAIEVNHEDASSLADNRFLNESDAMVQIRPNGSRLIWYDGDSMRWRTV